MADVFISYKSERRSAAQHLSRILDLNGYSVWFDYGLLSGTDFGRQIERKIRAAKAVIVLWCSLSRDSTWVLEEAHLAQKLGTFTPAWLERVDLPLGFGRADTIDLSVWDGGPRSNLLDRLLREIARQVGRDPVQQFRGLVAYEESWRAFGAPSLANFALIAPLEAREEERLHTGKAVKEQAKQEAALKEAAEKKQERVAEEERHAPELEAERKAKEEEEKRRRAEEEKRRQEEAQAKRRAEEEATRKNAGGSPAQTGKGALIQIVGAILSVGGWVLVFLYYTGRINKIYPGTLCFGEYGTAEGCVDELISWIVLAAMLIGITAGPYLFKTGKNK